MRVLIVSSYLPYPLFSGGAVRLFNIMKALSKKHKLTLVCEKRSFQTSDDVKEVEKLCEQVVTVSRKPQWTLSNIIKTGFSTKPFLLTGHASSLMKQAIVKLLTTIHFDLIHVETFYVMQNVPQTYLPIVLVEHNIEYQVYERYMQTAPLYAKPLLFIDIQKIIHWERRSWEQATKLVAVSDVEKHLMGRSDAVVVPNGVDIKKFKYYSAHTKVQKKEKRILFIGDFKWIQNQKSAEWILQEIWPEIRSRLQSSQVKLWIVGRQIPQHIKNFGDNSILFDEHAPLETEKIYQKAFALLAPITVGGGTSYKILEAMASGTPVVTTTLGIQGLGARPQKDALVGETVKSLVAHVLSLLSDAQLYEAIALSARTFVERHFSWEEIANKLENVYAEATS